MTHDAGQTMKLGDIMTKSVVTVHMDDTLERIRDMFQESKFHHLLVIDEGKLVGVISDSRNRIESTNSIEGKNRIEGTLPERSSPLHRGAESSLVAHPIIAADS